MEHEARSVAEHNGTNDTPVTQRGARAQVLGGPSAAQPHGRSAGAGDAGSRQEAVDPCVSHIGTITVQPGIASQLE